MGARSGRAAGLWGWPRLCSARGMKDLTVVDRALVAAMCAVALFLIGLAAFWVWRAFNPPERRRS